MPDVSTLLAEGKAHRKPGRYPAKFNSQSAKSAGPNSVHQIDNKDSNEPQAASEEAIQNPRLPAPRLKRILEYVDAHLGENVTLADLARNSNLSLYYFATLFKKSTGLSPHRYILHRRVSRARQLLQNTDLSVLDVSLDLGFQHQNNFARAFRRVTGMTPTGFRQSNRLKQ
jgi:AraC family transcriptional regulator